MWSTRDSRKIKYYKLIPGATGSSKSKLTCFCFLFFYLNRTELYVLLLTQEAGTKPASCFFSFPSKKLNKKFGLFFFHCGLPKLHVSKYLRESVSACLGRLLPLLTLSPSSPFARVCVSCKMGANLGNQRRLGETQVVGAQTDGRKELPNSGRGRGESDVEKQGKTKRRRWGGGNKTGRGWKVEKVEKEPEPETGPLT